MTNLSETVAGLMHNLVFSVPSNASAQEAQRRLVANDCSTLAVTDGETLAGAVSWRNLADADREDLRVSEIMSTEVVSVEASELITVAARTMVTRRLQRVFVLTGGILTGVLSSRDIMAVVRDVRLNRPISSFMTGPVVTVDALAPLSLAIECLSLAEACGVIVTDQTGWPVGVFTEAEARVSLDCPQDTPIEEQMSFSVISMPAAMPMFRAAAQSEALNAHRIVALDGHRLRGVLTGLDFARAIVPGN